MLFLGFLPGFAAPDHRHLTSDHRRLGAADGVEREGFHGAGLPVTGMAEQRGGVTQPSDDSDVEGQDDDERDDGVSGQLHVLERSEHELGRCFTRLTRRRPYQCSVIILHCKHQA